jgi:cell division transport system permease protein
MLVELKRIIKYGIKTMTRDGEFVFASILTLAIVIFLISSLFLFREISQILISFLKEKADISVYFKSETAEEEILKLKEEISKIPEVKKVNYISKEEALKEFEKRHKENPELMNALKEIGENPFLASLDIKAWQMTQYEDIVSFLQQKEPLIEKIDYYQRKPLIERIFSLSSNLEKGGIIFSVFLTLVAIFVVFNTIRLSILNFKEEISIQRLVGASNWFIRGPFVVQGILSGIFSAFFSFLSLALFCWVLSPKVKILFDGLDIFQIFSEKILVIILIQFLVGIGLGVISSLIAIRRYLRV